MIIYPIDITIEQGKIKIYALDESYNHHTLFTSFENYFYATTKVEHESITKVEEVEKLFFGKVYKHTTTLNSGLKDITQGVGAYHHDVSVIQKFLIDTKLKFFTKSHITLDEDNASLIHTITQTDELIDFTKLIIMGIDIETYAKTKEINSQKNPILSIATVTKLPIQLPNNKTNKYESKLFTHAKHSELSETILTKDETETLHEFCTYVKSIKPHIIVGYNSDAFDFSYIHDRAQVHSVPLNIGFDAPLKFKTGQNPIALIPGFAHIDLYSYIRMHMRTQLETNSYSLNNVAKELLGEEKHDIDIAKLHIAWDTHNTQKQNAQKEIAKNTVQTNPSDTIVPSLDTYFAYNIQDAKLCVDLFIKLQENIFEFGRMIYATIQDITRMSYSQLVENYLMCCTNDYNTLIPPRPTNEQVNARLGSPKNLGAFVFKPTPGFYEHVVVFDYRSLYPSIIASLNIDKGVMSTNGESKYKVPEYPTPLYFDQSKQSFIPHVTEQIVVRRDEIKATLKKVKKEEQALLKARIYNLKILANSLYGYLSFARARWYCSQCGGATTAYARHFIKKTIDTATQKGFTVIYSDTDSIFLELKKKTTQDALDFVTEFNLQLPGIMELQFEDEFETGIFVSAKGKEGGAKKRYALYDANKDYFKIAGLEYVRTDWTPIARQTQYEILEFILKEKNAKKAFEHVKAIIAKIRTNKIPYSEFILSSKISREIDQYESNSPHVTIAKELIKRGETVNTKTNLHFVIVKGKGALYEKAKLPSDATLDDLDEEYYINNQLIPATISLLSVFGYNESDLLHKHSQNNLDSFFN
jgi:DNA polymerase, archaea type